MENLNGAINHNRNLKVMKTTQGIPTKLEDGAGVSRVPPPALAVPRDQQGPAPTRS